MHSLFDNFLVFGLQRTLPNDATSVETVVVFDSMGCLTQIFTWVFRKLFQQYFFKNAINEVKNSVSQILRLTKFYEKRLEIIVYALTF